MLVDTSIWVEAFWDRHSPAKDLLDTAISQEEVLVGDLVLVELLQGYREGTKLRLASAALQGFPVVTLCGPEIAPLAAANYRALRRAGYTVRGTIDVVIATWCIQNRTALLHNDRDFTVMEEVLGLIAWR